MNSKKRKSVASSHLGNLDRTESTISVVRNFDKLDSMLRDHIDSTVEEPESVGDKHKVIYTKKSSKQIKLTKSKSSLSGSSSEPVRSGKVSNPKSKSLKKSASFLQKYNLGLIPTSKYTFIQDIASGSYGEVGKYLYNDTLNTFAPPKVVAIKVIDKPLEKAEDSKRIFRETYLLKRIKPIHIIELLDIIIPPNITLENAAELNKIALVFNHVDTNLQRLTKSTQLLGKSHVQYIMFQLITALHYLHNNHIVHRDLKPANILIFADCRLKLCDFGLSRIIPDGSKEPIESRVDDIVQEGTSQAATEAPPQKKIKKVLTTHVVTRWYRAPEIILLLHYSTKIDIWAAGCVFAELLQMLTMAHEERYPLFPGRTCFPLTAEDENARVSHSDQLNEIFKIIGTPTEQDMREPGTEKVRGYFRGLPKVRKSDLRKSLYKPPKNDPSAAPPDVISDLAVNLLENMLLFSQHRRFDAKQCLEHEYFQHGREFEVLTETIENKGLEDLGWKESTGKYKHLIVEEALSFNKAP